jgi:hypothetical protein
MIESLWDKLDVIAVDGHMKYIKFLLKHGADPPEEYENREILMESIRDRGMKKKESSVSSSNGTISSTK